MLEQAHNAHLKHSLFWRRPYIASQTCPCYVYQVHVHQYCSTKCEHSFLACLYTHISHAHLLNSNTMFSSTHMHTHTHTHTRTLPHTHTHTHKHSHTHTYTHMHIHIHTHMHLHIHTHTQHTQHTHTLFYYLGWTGFDLVCLFVACTSVEY